MTTKIMHIVQSAGGVEEYIFLLINNMNLNKYNNILVTSFDYEKNRFEKIVTNHEQINMQRNINFIKDIRAILQIRKLIKKSSPDIIYMHSSKAGALGRIANIGISNISIYNAHGWSFNMECGRLKKALYIFIERGLALFCNKIIAISNFEKNSAIKYKVCKPKKIKVIFNGIDIKKYAQVKALTRKKLGIPHDAYIIGMVGRITKQKAPDTFIKAAQKIKEKIPNAYFIIVGDGDERDKIEKLIIEKNLKDSTYITGWVKKPMEYIKLFDQAMILSRWEGFGLVLAEYMFARKAIIATRVDAIPNIIEHEVNGLLVKVNSVEEINNACLKIFNNKDLSNILIDNGYKIVCEKYNINRVVQEHYELFNVIGI